MVKFRNKISRDKIRIALILIFLREFRFNSQKINFKLRNVPLKKIVNAIKVELNVAIKTPLFRCFPINLQVNPFFGCNLSCPKCPSHQRNGKIKPGALSLSIYKKFLDETGNHALMLTLFSWGEPFLNKNLPEMIKYAKDKKMIVFDEEFNRRILLSGLDLLIIALDGATEKTYLKYRKGGDFKKVIKGIQDIVKLKKQLNVKKPLINIRMIVSQHNEHEIPLITKLAEKLDVDALTLKTVNPNIDRRIADEKLIPKNKRYHRYAYHPGTLKKIETDEYFCPYLWLSSTLFSDGTIVPCEFDYTANFPYGNITNKSFKEIWFGEKAQQFRHNFLKNKGVYAFCKNCPYKDLIVDSCVVEKVELAGKP
jgi:radical SAM protein with 4Fe4S-binding SPASM domain